MGLGPFPGGFPGGPTPYTGALPGGIPTRPPGRFQQFMGQPGMGNALMQAGGALLGNIGQPGTGFGQAFSAMGGHLQEARRYAEEEERRQTAEKRRQAAEKRHQVQSDLVRRQAEAALEQADWRKKTRLTPAEEAKLEGDAYAGRLTATGNYRSGEREKERIAGERREISRRGGTVEGVDPQLYPQELGFLDKRDRERARTESVEDTGAKARATAKAYAGTTPRPPSPRRAGDLPWTSQELIRTTQRELDAARKDRKLGYESSLGDPARAKEKKAEIRAYAARLLPKMEGLTDQEKADKIIQAAGSFDVTPAELAAILDELTFGAGAGQ